MDVKCLYDKQISIMACYWHLYTQIPTFRQMLQNFFKTALRYLVRDISFTLINIIGLTAGIAAFLLIALFLQNERSYDTHLPDDVVLYRLVGIQEPAGIDVQHVAISSGGWAPYLNENVPEVTGAFRIMGASNILLAEGKQFRVSTFFADGHTLGFFGLPLVSTDGRRGLLDRPNTAAISKEAAMRIYGTADATGQVLRHNQILYTVIAVYDNSDIQSHLRFDALLSLSTVEADNEWLPYLGNNSLITYIVLPPEGDPGRVASLINGHYQRESGQLQEGAFMKNTFYLQPAGDIYLRSGQIDIQIVSAAGNINTVYLFTLVAILVLAIACINFINLSTANAGRRAREVGMRKVLGASRGKLALQFIGESMVLTFMSVLLALVLLEFIIPEFNSLLGSSLRLDFLGNPLLNVGLLAVLVVVGLVAGFYPGVVMSRFQPVQVLKSGTQSGKPQSALLRKLLVVFQFAISAALILSTIVVLHQVRHMQSKDLGYDPEHVIYITFDEGDGYERLRDFKARLEELPQISAIGMASNYNGVAGKQSTIYVADSVNTILMARFGYVDPDFFPAMGIGIVKGRNFSYDAATDPYQAALINEAAWRALGWENPLGQRVRNTYHEDYDYFTIVGVVKDYNYYPVRLPVAPAIYLYQKDRIAAVNIRYSGNDPQQVLARVEEIYRATFPGLPFQPRFITETLARQTRTESNIMKIFLWSSVLCILISCMGLFGLTAYMMSQRKKEISMRKVLGGSVASINLMLVNGFLRVVLLAVLIALPVAYLLMNRWLDNYPYRIGIGAAHFALVLLIITGIAAITVLFYSTRAARQNPVTNLKYE